MSGRRFDAIYRETGGRVLAALAARLRDLDAAEEALAAAWASAVATWETRPPADAGAWLYAVALRKAVSATRRAITRDRAVHDEPTPEPTPEDILMDALDPIPDERLRLIFVCCHPALAPEARVALTLKTVCGLPVDRLARAFLTSEATMLQRLVRAKRKIRDAGVPFEVPARDQWAARVATVLATLEIAYLQAYEDAALTSEAAQFGLDVVRITGILAELLTDDAEVLGLAALVRLAEARRHARVDENGAMVPLDRQDAGLWDARLIDDGNRMLARAARLPERGPYQLLAAIHAAHASRRQTGVTPWPAILGLYDALLAVRPSPVVALNRAVVLAQVDGADAGLAAMQTAGATPVLETGLPWLAAKAALLRQAGRRLEARAAYVGALAAAPAPAERRFLEAELASL